MSANITTHDFGVELILAIFAGLLVLAVVDGLLAVRREHKREDKDRGNRAKELAEYGEREGGGRDGD